MEVNYLKLGDKTYSINEIDATGLDINAELKENYYQRQTALSKEFGKVTNQEIDKQWDSQIAHLRKITKYKGVSVPENMFNKPIIVFNNILMETRTILYAPDKVVTSLEYLIRRLGIDTETNELLKDFSEGSSLLLTIKPIFCIPLLISYDPKSEMLFTPLQYTFHTMSNYSICTGRHTGKDFWRLNDEGLEREFNKINTFSPAQTNIIIRDNNISIRALINSNTITHAVLRREGEGTWKI